jgi:hypothetical protein
MSCKARPCREVGLLFCLYGDVTEHSVHAIRKSDHRSLFALKLSTMPNALASTTITKNLSHNFHKSR